MKRLTSLLGVIVTTTSLACGGDAPEPPPQDAPPPPEGVSGRAPEAVRGIPSVVVLRPAADAPSEPPSEVALMDQLGLAFTPSRLVVRPGQTLRFANSESLAHNVHVTFTANDSTVFLADMDPDDHTETVLEQEGGYDVTCDEHPGMSAFIYVTSSPYATFAEADGSFSMPDVPPGSYSAEVWSPSPDLRTERSVEVTGPGTELDLTASP